MSVIGKMLTPLLVFLYLFSHLTKLSAQSQRIRNSCGVTAVINPGNDSIVNTNTIVNFTSVSVNATSYQFIIANIAYPLNTSVNYSIPNGLTTIKLVAYNGNCTDTAVCYYFFPGTFPADSLNV